MTPADLMRQAYRLHQAGDLDTAAALYRQILTLRPDDAEAQYLLGYIARQRGQLPEALQLIAAAIRADGREAAFHQTHAAVLFALGRWPEAAQACHEALQRDPDDAQTWSLLGMAHRELGDLAQAGSCMEQALRLDPESTDSLCAAAAARRDAGEIDPALDLYRRARAIAPQNVDVLSGYLFTLNLSTRLSRAEIFREHLACEELLGDLPRTAPQPAREHSDTRLRLGYLSPDFRFHAVALFVEPLLVHHDRRRFETYCYYLYPQHDDMTRRLRECSDHWRECAPLGDADIAAQIAEDRIDILVDLAGHTAWGRIGVLARRPAPVIATWLGYLNTTGLRAVDYRITDAHTDPPGATEAFHTERLVRLPASQWCRLKPAFPVAAAAASRPAEGALRFGSFNKASKLTPEVLDLWARLLKRLPAATLLVAGVEEGRRTALRERLTTQGIDDARLSFAGRLPLIDYLRLHQEVDIALDAFPYSGATTTLDSLWMGVPVLTLAGEAPISRSTASILATLGMTEWIARNEPEFLSAAARLSGDRAALAALRARLRPRLEDSILMDGAAFTGQFEELLLGIARPARGRARTAG